MTTKEILSLYHDGIHFLRGKEYDEAILAFGKAIERDSNLVEAYYHRGVCYHQLEKYDEAVSDFQKVISLESETSIEKYSGFAKRDIEIIYEHLGVRKGLWTRIKESF